MSQTARLYRSYYVIKHYHYFKNWRRLMKFWTVYTLRAIQASSFRFNQSATVSPHQYHPPVLKFIHSSIHSSVQLCIHAFAHAYTHTSIQPSNMHSCMSSCTRAHTHTHTRIRTHTPRSTLVHRKRRYFLFNSALPLISSRSPDLYRNVIYNNNQLNCIISIWQS